MHFFDSFDFLVIKFDPLVRHHVPKQFSRVDSERALLCVGDEIFLLFGLDDEIVDVGLNISANLFM